MKVDTEAEFFGVEFRIHWRIARGNYCLRYKLGENRGCSGEFQAASVGELLTTD